MFIVVGGRSFLGSYLVKKLLERSNEKVIATFHSPECEQLPSHEHLCWFNLDISDVESIKRFSQFIRVNQQPNEKVKCIYVIGYIKPDLCLHNPEVALNVNLLGLSNFLIETRDIVDSLIFTSTDFVFSESISGYKHKESDTPNPINLYGWIKYCCEQTVRLQGYTSVRLPFMFGRSLLNGRPHFIEHIEEVVKSGKDFEVLSDYYENSLDYETVASCIVELFMRFGVEIPEPIIHICADKPISKYEIAIAFAKQNNLPIDHLKPLRLQDAHFFDAKRATILLDNSRLKSLIEVKSLSPKF